MFRCDVCENIWEPFDRHDDRWIRCPDCSSEQFHECEPDESVRLAWVEELARMARHHLEWGRDDGDTEAFADAIVALCRDEWHLPQWWNSADRDHLISLLER